MAKGVDPAVERLLQLLLPLGPVEARRLFGGYGFYLEGTIFALIHDGVLFLKADAETEPAFKRRGLGPITYEGGRGQTIALPYWEAPPELLGDGKALCRWAKDAYEAGLRANAKGGRKSKRTANAGKAAESMAPRRKPCYEPDF